MAAARLVRKSYHLPTYLPGLTQHVRFIAFLAVAHTTCALVQSATATRTVAWVPISFRGATALHGRWRTGVPVAVVDRDRTASARKTLSMGAVPRVRASSLFRA